MPAILRVLTHSLKTGEDAAGVVRLLRHTTARSETDAAVLLLCALPDAPGKHMPEDAPLIRALQSGVMSLSRHAAGRFDLLVLRRTWSDAARIWIGCESAASVRRAACDLLIHGRTDAAFEAATISPSAVKERLSSCAAVLFSDLSLSCTPDTPQRMLSALQSSGSAHVRAHVLAQQEYPQIVLTRLCASGFSLVPPGISAPGDDPILVSALALDQALLSEPPCFAAECLFVRRDSPSLRALLSCFHRDCLFRPGLYALLPCAQLLALLASAALGMPALAAAALLVPEYHALRHPLRLPGVLARVALLPAATAAAFDAALMRITAHTRIRLRVPPELRRASGSVVSGLLLLASALFGVHALAALLPVSVLWLAAPYIHPALGRPTIARIPLLPHELSVIRSHAEGAYFAASNHLSVPSAIPFRMLCEAAGAMLRLIEPDEAARRAESLLAQYTSLSPAAASAADQAAMLVCAQYLREHMGDCDAALRALPAAIESCVLALPLPQESSRLGAFLRAARTEDASVFRAACAQGDALDALFLPLAPAHDMPPHSVTLALTHPHAFIRSLDREPPPQKEEAAESAGRFLAAAAAALAHPFYALFLRSPIAAPYGALLATP